MREHGRALGDRVRDVVRERAVLRIELRDVTDALGNLVVRAGCIAADAEPSDAAPVLVERHAAADRDGSTADLALRVGGILWRLKASGVECVGTTGAPQRVSRQS